MKLGKIYKIKIFIIAVFNFFKWSLMFAKEWRSFNDVKSDVIESYQDSITFYKLSTNKTYKDIIDKLT